MGRTAAAETVGRLKYATPGGAVVPWRTLLLQLVLLAFPTLIENLLHMVVGLTDVYLAGHLPKDAAAAVAAVGSIAYILWLISLIVATIGTGSTAIIARAVGARHRSLANSVCGQSVACALVLGLMLGVVGFTLAGPIAQLSGLSGEARQFALVYLRILSFSLPFSTLMFTANACLRGAGDTVTPAVSMVIVDGSNALLSATLALGWFGVPAMGFKGIAIGTAVAYTLGGVLQFIVLLGGWGGVRLHLHRLRPHWHTMRRIFRIGLPSGAEMLIAWAANFVILVLINRMDAQSLAGSAHIVAIRMESLSFLGGFAIATAAATMVGQSLGMKDPVRAQRSAFVAYGVGGGWMLLFGLMFILLPRAFASVLSDDPRVIELAARCLFITGFAQLGFAAAMIFGGALRGAGDTFVVMILNLATILTLRLVGAILVAYVFKLGLAAVWVVLASELMLRGILVFGRFLQGGWKRAEV